MTHQRSGDNYLILKLTNALWNKQMCLNVLFLRPLLARNVISSGKSNFTLSNSMTENHIHDKWRSLSQSELTLIIFHLELTHLGFETSEYLVNL